MPAFCFPIVIPLLLLLFPPPPAAPFTVIMSDSTTPSALIDGPQTGFSITKDGARTDPSDQEAVYDIMRATGNDWATEIPDVCRGRWHGIECMPDKNNVYHVVSLAFGALSDDTAFPTCDPTRSRMSESIAKLPHIRTLFFYRCFRHNPQPIPGFLGRLGSNLQTLVLRENGLLGSIPNELGNLTQLRVLDLHKNDLNGSIPFSLAQLTGLRSLDLSGNRLTGTIPNLLSPVLSVLDLSQNLLTGPIPTTVGMCRSLIKIDFSHNRLDGAVPKSFSLLKDLILLDLSYNRFPGPIPSSFRGLSSLQALILKGNLMGKMAIPNDVFKGMENLMILVLSNMDLQGPIPESLGELPNLSVLHLDGNRLNCSIPTNFRDLRRLSELRLNDNRLVGQVPFGREMVWKLRRKLRLQNNLGLCLNEDSEIRDVLDSTFGSGIGVCGSPGSLSSSWKAVQHLSGVDDDAKKSMNALSSGSEGRVLGLVRSFQVVGLLGFVCVLL